MIEQNIRIRRRRIPVSAPHLALQLPGPPTGVADHDYDLLGPLASSYGPKHLIHRTYRYILSQVMYHIELMFICMEHEARIGRHGTTVVDIHLAHLSRRFYAKTSEKRGERYSLHHTIYYQPECTLFAVFHQ